MPTLTQAEIDLIIGLIVPVLGVLWKYLNDWMQANVHDPRLRAIIKDFIFAAAQMASLEGPAAHEWVLQKTLLVFPKVDSRIISGLIDSVYRQVKAELIAHEAQVAEAKVRLAQASTSVPGDLSGHSVSGVLSLLKAST